MGLVNHVVPRDRLLAAAREMAAQIADANPTMVRQMKHLYGRTTRSSLGDALRIEQEVSREFIRNANLGEVGSAIDSVIARGRTQASKN
jgi:enoyl-CoA hydratase/carnithine racemase